MLPTPPDPRSPKDAWDDQHRELAHSAVAWVLNADALISVFELLAAEDERAYASGQNAPRISSVTYMLAGFAVEVLLKALLVQKKTYVNSNGRFKLDSHHLAQLAEDAEIPLTVEEVRLLERLEQFLMWAGRYPIPLTSEPMRPHERPNGGFAPRTYHHLGEDWAAIRLLFAKLKQSLPVVQYDKK